MNSTNGSSALGDSPRRHSNQGAIPKGRRPPLEHQAMKRPALVRELNLVGAIQRSLLPAHLPHIPGFDVASFYRPSALAGGDYYDIVPLAKDRWGLVMADVAGHGVSATVIMAVMRALVHAHLPHTRYLPANAFLEFINEQMTGAYTDNGRFVTVWAAVLDPTTRRLTYASAGHNPPRLVRGNTVVALDAVGGLPVGISNVATYEEASVTLELRDLLVIYTDGITETANDNAEHREEFGTDRLDAILLESRTRNANDCAQHVVAALDEFTQASIPTDDQTMLIVRTIPE